MPLLRRIKASLSQIGVALLDSSATNISLSARENLYDDNRVQFLAFQI